jgi:predicted RNA binding protein YcfA (HicA-like mRNA interferase family)
MPGGRRWLPDPLAHASPSIRPDFESSSLTVAAAKKELKEISREAERQGWRVGKTKKGHAQFFAPDGEGIVTAAGTPSDHRSIDNLIAMLRRYGFKWKGR